MKRALIKWYYRRKFVRAATTLERLARRHRDAGHEVHLTAVNEAHLSLYCVKCPELQPLKRHPQDVEHITVDSLGKPYKM